jgi:RNA polymerase sigma factor (sigma-70 family)
MREVRLVVRWSEEEHFLPEISNGHPSYPSCTASSAGLDGTNLDMVDLEQFAKGDELAPERIVNRHRGTLKSRAVRLLHNGSAADEVVQETFERMFAALDHFDSKRPLAAWLNRILTNLCIDRLRAAKRQPEFVSLQDPRLNSTSIADWSRAPDQALIAEEEERWICESLLRLPPKLRFSIERFALEGKQQQAIANELNTSQKAVEMDLFHARVFLRGLLLERKTLERPSRTLQRNTFCIRDGKKEPSSTNRCGAAKRHSL